MKVGWNAIAPQAMYLVYHKSQKMHNKGGNSHFEAEALVTMQKRLDPELIF